jgi:membrane protease subunit HflC
MNKPFAVIAALVLFALLALFTTTYTVRFNEVAIRTTFGKVGAGSVIDSPGLHFKLPAPAQRVTRLDTRLQLLETPFETVPTTDGQQVVVRAFLLWQVDTREDGPLTYAKKYPSGDPAETNGLIGARVLTAVRTALSRYQFADLVGAQSNLPAAEDSILAELASLRDDGISPVTVGISQVVLPPATTTAVLRRMEAQAKVLALAERQKGQSEATNILSAANSKADRILSFASVLAEEIRSKGGERAAEYLSAMAQDEEFAIFLIWVDTLRAAFSKYTTIILPATIEPAHLLNPNVKLSPSGIPVPDEPLLAGGLPAAPAGQSLAPAGASSTADPSPTLDGSAAPPLTPEHGPGPGGRP